MPRKLSNWLKTYQEYTEETESAPIFHTWVGLSMLSAALGKTVWLNLGRIRVYPNMYVVLVAEPGIARKTQAITYAMDVMEGLGGAIKTSADSITREALLQDLEASRTSYFIHGVEKFHCSLNIVSKEFESFLGQKKENTRMLVLLTDLFDAQEMPWRYRTKQSGDSVIASPCLNILAATTPGSLASSLPASAIGGGLTSRMIFIWAAKGGPKQAYPTFTKELALMRDMLIHDLSVIERTAGNYTFTPDAREKWETWYNKYDERSSSRRCKDPAFHGWYSRKPTFILKLAILHTISKHMEQKIEWTEIQEAMTTLEEAEGLMGSTFQAIGRSEVAPDVALVKDIVKQHGKIAEKDLLQIVWRDMDWKKFDGVIMTAMRSGDIKRQFYTKNTKKPGIWYVWVGD